MASAFDVVVEGGGERLFALHGFCRIRMALPFHLVLVIGCHQKVHNFRLAIRAHEYRGVISGSASMSATL